MLDSLSQDSGPEVLRLIKLGPASNLRVGPADKASMDQPDQTAIDEVANIVAEAATLPLLDAAFAL